jgi:hypothetical protein
MENPELLKAPIGCEEGLLMRNVDLARQRLVRREGELERLLRENSMSRKERARLINYTMSGLNAAHDELRGAVADLTAYDPCEAQVQEVV